MLFELEEPRFEEEPEEFEEELSEPPSPTTVNSGLRLLYASVPRYLPSLSRFSPVARKRRVWVPAPTSGRTKEPETLPLPSVFCWCTTQAP